MVNYKTMLVVNIADAKARLSQFLELVEQGERVVISRRNRPVAELRALTPGRTDPRPIGLARGRFTLPEAFFEPLSDALADAFEGLEPRRPERARVAESPEEYGRRRGGGAGRRK